MANDNKLVNLADLKEAFDNVSITKSQVSDLGTIGAAAAKGVDTSIATSSTSTNLPTSQAVAAFVEGKGYKTTDNNTTYSLTQDSSDGHKITLTPSSGTAQTITIPDNNTDTKVTSAANHYTPSRDTSADKSASASGATAAWSIDVVKGVTVQTDGKGHVTGVAVTSGKIPGNPNTDTHRPVQVNDTQILGNDTTALNLKAGSNVSITNSSGTVTIAATDTTYSSKAAASGGTDVSLVTTGEKATWNAKTSNIGTITGITMNGASKGTSGVVDLGTVITSHQDISGKAPLASPALTGTPTAPTAATTTENTQIATTAYVKNKIDSVLAANDAMIFKGTIGSSGATVTALPNTHNAGWTYKVITAATYAGKVCEVGDLIICITDGTAANNDHWTVVQTNVDGAVTGPASSTGDHIAIFNGTSGKIIKDSGYTIAKSVPSNAVFTDTDTKVTAVGNHYTPAEDTSAKLSADASSSTAATWNSTSLVTGVDIKRDAKGHVVGVAVDSIKMPANPNSDTHRAIQVNGTQALGNNTTALNLKAGSNVTITDGGSGAITIAATDTNTWRGIQDNLTSTSTTESLSANQGKVLKGLVDGKAASGHTHNYAGSTSAGGPASLLAGTYSGNGGQLTPSAVSGGQVKAAMMNNPKGLSGFPTYADTLLMDTYTGSDVPWTTGLGIIKQDASPRMFIFNGAKGNTTTWKNITEVVTTGNFTNQSLTKSQVTTALGYTPPTTDTNTWRPVSDSVSSTSSSDAASSKAVKTAYDLAASKTANTGTVTSVATGVGLTGGTITGSGTLKAKLRSETALTIDSAAATTTSGRVYPVAVDKTGYLAVNVPWTDNNTTYSAGTGLTLSGTTFSNSGVTSVNNQTGAVSITPANIGAVAKSGDTITGPLVINNGSGTGVKIYADAEGGNIAIHSPSGHVFEFDATDDYRLRCYARDSESVTTDSCHFTFNRVDGKLSATGGFEGNATSATNVLGVVGTDHGGTGATTPASARANLEITPANIGAAPAAYVQYGSTVTGNTHISLPSSGYNDMVAFINVGGYKFTISIPKVIGWTGTHIFPFGVYNTVSGTVFGQLKVESGDIYVANAYFNGNDTLSGTSLSIYCR